MADSFSQVTGTSWFGRIGNALKSMLLGVILFLAAFVVLFWNEGRAVETARSLAEGARDVVSVEAAAVKPENEGKLIHLTGTAATTETLRDAQFQVAAPALKLLRTVEMFQWVEDKKSETRKKLGGGEETTTTYTYNKQWSESWNDSAKFNQSADHKNPPPTVVSSKLVAQKITVGAFTLSASLVGQITNSQPLDLPADAPAALPDGFKKTGAGYYRGDNPDAPQIGDLRVKFALVPPQEISAVAQQAGSALRGYATKAGRTLEMLDLGSHSADEMFKEAAARNAHLTWILRLVGFLAMWFGLMLVLNPLKILADVVPFFGNIVGAGLLLVAALVALPLSLLTIAVAWFFYRPLLSLGILAVAALGTVGIAMLIQRRKPKVAAATT